jgi:hypothetical protein
MDGTSQEKSADPYERLVDAVIDGALQDRPSSTPSASSSLDWRSSVALRTTSVFRNEGGAWKLMHRRADPITSARSADSVMQQ